MTPKELPDDYDKAYFAINGAYPDPDSVPDWKRKRWEARKLPNDQNPPILSTRWKVYAGAMVLVGIIFLIGSVSHSGGSSSSPSDSTSPSDLAAAGPSNMAAAGNSTAGYTIRRNSYVDGYLVASVYFVNEATRSDAASTCFSGFPGAVKVGLTDKSAYNAGCVDGANDLADQSAPGGSYEY
jgi:hypothetical protein